MHASRKWWIWFALALVAVAIAAGYKFWAEKNAVPAFRTTKIEKGAITASVSATGTLAAVVSVQVGSQVSGQLKEIYVDFNSEVTKDQLIARIDPQTFEHRVRQAQADLDSARAQTLTQQATIAAQRAQAGQVEVNVANAKRDLDRKQQLMEKGFISGAERDTVLATYNALAEQVKAAKAQVQVAESNAIAAAAVVRQREASLAQARIDLERTAIRAPVNGIVIKRSVDKGQTVAASLQAPELFIIAENLTEMRVDTAIDESEIGRIRDGQKATFTVDAFPGRTFEGSVKQIRKAAQNVSNVVTYMVEVSAPNPGKELLPGMTANVRVVTDSRSDVLKVASSALRYKPPGAAASGPRSGAADSQSGAPSDDAAPRGGREGGGGGGGGQNRAMRERLEKELELNEAQKAKLDTIFSGMREKMMATREAPDRQKAGERIRMEMRAQITEILTPAQKQKYEEIMAAQGGRRTGATARGRIYTVDAEGQPKELNVRLGLSDGSMTEVISSEISEGMEVIIGAALPPAAAGSRPASRQGGPRMF
jgi:HlyD family secretion protein